MLQYVAIGYIIVGFLREWCSRAGGNWGTLWSLWGTLGKIRGITTPPQESYHDIRFATTWWTEADEAGRTIRFEIPDVSWSVFYTRKTFKKGKVAQRAKDNLNGYLGGGFKYSFTFTPILGEMIPFDLYFSTGLKPPTSKVVWKGDENTCLFVYLRPDWNLISD